MHAKTLNPKPSLAEYTRLLTCPRGGEMIPEGIRWIPIRYHHRIFFY